MTGKVYVALVNWNGWRHTIECLESLARQEYRNFQIVICDNASRDGSIEKIRAWASGALQATSQGNETISQLTSPPVLKPMSLIAYDKTTAEQGGLADGARCRIVLVELDKNYGFAGANNVALRYAFSRADVDYVWLLNNDTVVRADALKELVDTMRSNESIGICGSTLLDYDVPSRVQAAGGCAYSRWLGISFKRLRSAEHSKVHLRSESAKGIDYIVGASMMVSRALLEKVGLMNESYFLYFEEIDWAMRAKGLFTLGYSPRSLVYHKMGASIGQKHSASLRKQYRSEFYFLKNRLRFTSTYFPYAVPTVCLVVLGTYLRRLFGGHAREAALLLRVSRRVVREWRSGVRGFRSTGAAKAGQ